MNAVLDELRDLERGAPALAEKLLKKDPARTASAQKLAATKKSFDAAEDRTDSACAALGAIAEKLPEASEAARKVLVRERAELSAEVLHAPSEVAAAAEAFVDALIAWAPPVYQAARRRVAALNAELAPLEYRRNQARHKLEQLGGVSTEVAEGLRAAGLDVKPDDVGRDEASRVSLEKELRERVAEVTKIKEERLALADLASSTQAQLTRRFGQGYGDLLYDSAGTRRWLEGVRHRVSSQVAPWTGTRDALRPVGA